MSKKIDLEKMDLGIDEIVDKVEGVEAKSNFNLKEIPLEQIKYSEKNSFGIRDIDELAESLKKHGQLHNAVVRKIDDPIFSYEMLSGERRHRAAKKIQWKTLMCTVVEVDDVEAEMILIIANLDTRELNDIERGKNAKRLSELITQKRKQGEDFGGKKTREVVAEKMKVAPATVQKLLKLENLIPELKVLVEEKKVGLELANQYAQMTEEVQKMVYQSLLEGMQFTAKSAKELKDKIKKQEQTYENLISDMKLQIENKNKELKEAKEVSSKKYEEIIIENDKLKKQAETSQNRWEVIKDEYTKVKKEAEEKEKKLKSNTDKIKEELEKELSKKLENQQVSKINDLKNKILSAENKEKKLIEENNKIVLELENKVKSVEKENNKIKNELISKEQEQKVKAINENNIVMNMELIALSKQVKQLLYTLTNKLTDCKNREGFELTEGTKKAIAEVSAYGDDLVN